MKRGIQLLAAQKSARAARIADLYHPRSVLRFNRPTKSLHPTQKPLELPEWLVDSFSNRNGVILDPFAGSGTTGIAAKRLGRRCVLIEQDREYSDIIVNRIESEG